MSKNSDNVCADMNWWPSLYVAEIEKKRSIGPCSMGAVFGLAKVFFSKFRHSNGQQRPDYRGFLISAVMDTIDNGLESDSFHEKTGHTQPRYARLANLVKVLHNLYQAKRQKAWIRNRINSSCALGLVNQMEKRVGGFMFSCPFERVIA